MGLSDATRASLLVRIRDPRDRAAWGEFVEIYAPLVHAQARRRGLQDADAADLTQDVMRSVLAAASRFDYDPSKGTFRGWLFTVTRNALNSFLVAQRRQPCGTGDSSMQQRLDEQASPQHESAAWEREYDMRLLAYASDRVRLEFEDSTWRAFWQTAVEGKPAKEVARELGLSVGAVYISKSRVMGRIREEVRRLQGE